MLTGIATALLLWFAAACCGAVGFWCGFSVAVSHMERRRHEWPSMN